MAEWMHDYTKSINNIYIKVPIIQVSSLILKHKWQFPVDDEVLRKPN